VSVAHITWTSGPTTTRRVPIAAGQDSVASTPRLLTVKEVAVACQLSEKAVRRAIDDGELVAIKLRSRLRVTPDDFQSWIASQRHRRRHQVASSGQLRARRAAPAGTFRALFEADAEQRGMVS
jgi:excisionase family DNA binding protein